MLFEVSLHVGYYEGDLQLWEDAEIRVHYDFDVPEIGWLNPDQREIIYELADAQATKQFQDMKCQVAFTHLKDIDFVYEMCPYCGEDIKLDAVEEASFEDHGKCHSCHKEWQMNYEERKEEEIDDE